jgi:hypothetical protein
LGRLAFGLQGDVMGGLPGDLGIAGSLLGFRCGIAGGLLSGLSGNAGQPRSACSTVRASRATLRAWRAAGRSVPGCFTPDLGWELADDQQLAGLVAAFDVSKRDRSVTSQSVAQQRNI